MQSSNYFLTKLKKKKNLLKCHLLKFIPSMLRVKERCLQTYICAMHEKGPYAICRQHRPRSACTFVQADLDLCCLLTASVDTVVYSQTCVKQAPMGKPETGCLRQVLA